MGLTTDERRYLQRINDAMTVPLYPHDLNAEARVVVARLIDRRLIGLSFNLDSPYWSPYYITDGGRAALASAE